MKLTPEYQRLSGNPWLYVNHFIKQTDYMIRHKVRILILQGTNRQMNENTIIPIQGQLREETRQL